ncbi:hypothetical protein BB558_003137 [Smittium angustum]|uniref:Uncharacterized protein n=1 Tax=Smittium angustum TaxID=133377 RepID=A0A2U1J6S8_SMIAN|nr:hypothetical protein BB558_003137 [Smittium angustum]
MSDQSSSKNPTSNNLTSKTPTLHLQQKGKSNLNQSYPKPISAPQLQRNGLFRVDSEYNKSVRENQLSGRIDNIVKNYVQKDIFFEKLGEIYKSLRDLHTSVPEMIQNTNFKDMPSYISFQFKMKDIVTEINKLKDWQNVFRQNISLDRDKKILAEIDSLKYDFIGLKNKNLEYKQHIDTLRKYIIETKNISKKKSASFDGDWDDESPYYELARRFSKSKKSRDIKKIYNAIKLCIGEETYFSDGPAPNSGTKAEEKHKYSRLYIQGINRMSYRKLKNILYDFRFRLKKIHSLDFIGKKTLEFTVVSDYAKAFLYNCNDLGFMKHLENVDPSKPIDEEATGETVEKVKSAYIKRVQDSYSRSKNEKYKRYLEDLTLEVGIPLERDNSIPNSFGKLNENLFIEPKEKTPIRFYSEPPLTTKKRKIILSAETSEIDQEDIEFSSQFEIYETFQNESINTSQVDIRTPIYKPTSSNNFSSIDFSSSSVLNSIDSSVPNSPKTPTKKSNFRNTTNKNNKNGD